MRLLGWTLAGVLLAGAPSFAQLPPGTPPAGTPPATGTPPAAGAPPAAPPPAPVLDPKNNRLDALLMRWEEEVKKVDALKAVEAVHSIKDKRSGFTETYQGEIRYLKPGLASIVLTNKANAADYERVLITDAFIYRTLSRAKKIEIFDVPKPKPGQVADDNVMAFLMGMRAAEAKRRYDLKLVQETEWWLYVEVLPRFPADKVDFSRARLILSAKTFLPRNLWLEHNQINEETWDLPKLVTGRDASVQRSDFTPPTTAPAGWTVERVRPEGTVPPAKPFPPPAAPPRP